jgi:hypothetical protein
MCQRLSNYQRLYNVALALLAFVLMAYLPIIQRLGATGWRVVLRLAASAARLILAGVEGDVTNPPPSGSDLGAPSSLIAVEP